jgi:hypothetical protein
MKHDSLVGLQAVVLQTWTHSQMLFLNNRTESENIRSVESRRMHVMHAAALFMAHHDALPVLENFVAESSELLSSDAEEMPALEGEEDDEMPVMDWGRRGSTPVNVWGG